jgi:hypothetical protein
MKHPATHLGSRERFSPPCRAAACRHAVAVIVRVDPSDVRRGHKGQPYKGIVHQQRSGGGKPALQS